MTKPISVSIIIPAYNEEGGIKGVLDELLSTDDIPTETEIIVVDDGSEDRTLEVIPQHEKIIVLKHETNRGYGASIKTGMRHASHELICITDADGTYSCDCIAELIAKLVSDKYDMVVGARIGKNVAIPVIRRPAKWVLGQLANSVANQEIPDLNSGLRVFRRPVALHFFNLLPDGFSFTTTLTLAMLTNRYRVDYIPINYYPRIGRSKIRPIRDTMNFVLLILRVALYFAPLKVFLPLSGFLILIALLWALFSIFVLDKLADLSTLIILMTAIQIGSLGLLAELINHRVSDYNSSGKD